MSLLIFNKNYFILSFNSHNWFFPFFTSQPQHCRRFMVFIPKQPFTLIYICWFFNVTFYFWLNYSDYKQATIELEILNSVILWKPVSSHCINILNWDQCKQLKGWPDICRPDKGCGNLLALKLSDSSYRQPENMTSMTPNCCTKSSPQYIKDFKER